MNKYFYINIKGGNINIRYNNIIQNLKKNNIRYYNYIQGNIILSNLVINVPLIYKYFIVIDKHSNNNIQNYVKKIYYYNYVYDYKLLINFIIL